MLVVGIPIGTVPLFVTVAVWIAEAIPTGVENVSELGETAMAGFAPVPCNSIVELRPVSLSAAASSTGSAGATS